MIKHLFILIAIIVITASTAEGAAAPADRKQDKKQEKTDDYFFFIAMGDGEMGYNLREGNTEPIENNDRFKQGLWVDGKLAYYLKAKIKGKYLITSSLDTQRDQKELFRYIDPDKYYPVYGDNSTISYEAANTQGMLYCLVEWDRSEVMWGNYNVAFNDTEFTRFSRTLYGGKVQLISASDTKFGEPKTKIIAFMAKANQKAAHNEFAGTGGSLYYLKHKYIVEGSDKLKIEVRDKITGLVIASLDQSQGSDYDIDYGEGRIAFTRPISHVAASESIISTHLLDGNKLYLVADYEYYTKDKQDEYSQGVRLSQQFKDYIRIGGTYVKDTQELEKNFELMGADTTIRLSKNIKFDAEYAQTKAEQGNNFISTDGGLSFSELPTDETAEGKAYGVSGEARLFDRLGLSAYYRRIGRSFSSPSTISNQGTEKMGGEVTLDILPGTYISARHDIQNLLADGNLQSQSQVGAEKTQSSTVQLKSQLTKKLEATAEYRRQEVSGKKEAYETESNANNNTVAGRIAYKLTEKLKLWTGHQETITGEKNQQTTVGAEATVNKYVNIRASEAVGTKGNATTVGADANVDDKLDMFTDYTISNEGKTAVFGAKKKLENGYEVSLGREFSEEKSGFASANTYQVAKSLGERRIEGTFKDRTANEEGGISNSNIFGLSGDINDKWAASFNFEKGDIQNLNGTQTKRTSLSGGVSYVNKNKMKASSKFEFRRDDSAEDAWQILSFNAVEGNVTQNMTLFTKVNISYTDNTGTDSIMSNFKEMVLGAAYRPIYHDKLNLIGKYTFLEDKSPSSQSDFKDIEHVKAHVFGLEGIYDLTDKFQIVEKGAFKHQDEKVYDFDFTTTQTWLLVNRLNYNVTKNWQVGGEYRVLSVTQAKDMKQGALFELSRRIGEHINIGAGYNFTDFSDDLTALGYSVHGPFVRITGTLYEGGKK